MLMNVSGNQSPTGTWPVFYFYSCLKLGAQFLITESNFKVRRQTVSEYNSCDIQLRTDTVYRGDFISIQLFQIWYGTQKSRNALAQL